MADLELTQASGGPDVSQPAGPLSRAAAILGTAAAGLFAYRALRSSKLGREITSAIGTDLRASRIGQFIRHASLPFFQGRDAAGLIVQDWTVGATRSMDVRLSGLTGIFEKTRNQLVQNLEKDGSKVRELGLGDRIHFEVGAVKDTLSSASTKSAQIWDFYRQPEVHKAALGGRFPKERMNRFERYAYESALAARQIPVRDSQVLGLEEIDRVLAQPNLHPSARGHLEQMREMRAGSGAVGDAALSGSERFGHSSPHTTHAAHQELLKDAAINPLFTTKPALGRAEQLLSKGQLRAETFEDVVGRMTRRGEKTRRFQTTHQGQSKFALIARSDYETAIKAAGGTTLYTGNFIDLARGRKSWDPYEASVRNVLLSSLKTLSHFKIPLLGFSPANFFKPKELEQWYGQGLMVHPVRGGQYLWVADGSHYEGLGHYQGGKLLRPTFGLPSVYEDEELRALKKSKSLFERKLKATRGAVLTSLPGEARQAQLSALSRQEHADLLDLVEDTSDLRPSELKKALGRGNASAALPAARFKGFEDYQGKRLRPGESVILTPGEDDFARFITANRGQHVKQPLPWEIMPFAIDKMEPIVNERGELDYSSVSGWSRGVTAFLHGLSKMGVDWRNQAEKPLPLHLLDIAGSVMGKGHSVLHVEDYGIHWGKVLEKSGEFGTAWHGNYSVLSSQWSQDYMLDFQASEAGAGGQSAWQGLRMEPVQKFASAKNKVDPEALSAAIEAAAASAVKHDDVAAYQALYQTRVPGGRNQTRVSYHGTVQVDGKPVAYEWKTRAQAVLSKKSEWMVARGEDISTAIKTWGVNRPLELLNELGVGGLDETSFHGPLGAAKALAGRIATAYYGYEALSYADYKMEQWTGVSPVKAIVKAGTIVDVARRAVMTPFIWGAQALEAYQPGAVTSPISYLMRMGVPLVAGALMTRKTGNLKPLMIGAAAAFMMAGDMTVGASEAADIYSGEQNVPIRRGRWWGMSDGSFFGEDITEWRPHWTAQVLLDAKHKGYPYKDQHQEWATKFGVPVPENWFGLRPILRPYEMDDYLQTVGAPTVMSSPHPITQLPVIGPLLTPLGALLKPARRMHPELPLPTEPAEEAAGRAAIVSIATRNNLDLAEQGLTANPARVEGPYSARAAVRKLFRFAEEIPGIYGWAAGSAIKNSLNIRDQGSYHYETAADDVSASADYWEKDIGGAFGLSEFVRRLFPRPRTGDQAISNVPNLMPSWLPAGDDIRSKDFHTGNPYGKLPEGELILPGKGYEARRPEVRGLDPEDYPSWAKLEILTSAAPFSTQARLAAEDVEIDLGGMIGKTRKRAETLLGQYMATSGDNLFRSVEASDVGFITAPMGLRASKLFGDEGSLSSFVRKRLLGRQLESWDDPVSSIAVPAFRYAGYQGGPLGGALRGAIMGSMFGDNPVAGVLSAAAGVAAGGFTGWRASSYQQTEGSVWMSEEAKKRIQIGEYFDKLRFVKADALYQKTKDPAFLEAATQTMYGSDPFGETWHVLASLPEGDRKYVQSFLQVENKTERSKILKATPGYLDRVLEAQWMMQDAASGALSDSELKNLKDMKTASWLETQVRLAGEDPDLAQYFDQNTLPQESWSGWAPDVPLESAKIKVVENEGLETAEMGIWQTERSRYERQQNQPLVPRPGNPTSGVTSSLGRLRNLLHPSQRRESSVAVESDRDRAETYIEVERSPYRDVRALMRYGL